MAEVFNHRYELFVGKPSELIERHNAPTGFEGQIPATIKSPDNTISIATGGYVDYVTVPNGAKLITQPIQMEADVKYSIGNTPGTPQSATIKVFNLSDDTLNFIEATAAVVLKAGYATDAELPVIFVGQVERAFTNRIGADNVTTLVCKEAANLLKAAKFVGSYPENQTYNFILLQLIKVFQDNGVPLGGFEESDRSIQSVKEDVAYSGKLSTILTKVCKSIDYTWFLSKGRLYVQPVELDRPLAFIEPARNQVIGTLKPNDDKTAIASKDKKGKPAGVKIDLFLNGEIGINTYLRLGAEFNTFEGDFKAESVRHRLNWQNGPWQTSIETQRVKEFATNITGLS